MISGLVLHTVIWEISNCRSGNDKKVNLDNGVQAYVCVSVTSTQVDALRIRDKGGAMVNYILCISTNCQWSQYEVE